MCHPAAAMAFWIAESFGGWRSAFARRAPFYCAMLPNIQQI
jgi:hypothetical protein